MRVIEKLKEKWQKYVKETVEANEKMWKDRKPSCCDSNGKNKREENKR